MKSEQPLSAGAARRSRVAVPAPAPIKLTKLVQTKIVTPRGPLMDAKTLERERLLAQLLAAQGRPAVSAATESLLRAGHDLPPDQEVHLQILEHGDESRVRDALATLAKILEQEPVKRRPVLEQRLKRLEAFADESSTREAATALRRKL